MTNKQITLRNLKNQENDCDKRVRKKNKITGKLKKSVEEQTKKNKY